MIALKSINESLPFSLILQFVVMSIYLYKLWNFLQVVFLNCLNNVHGECNIEANLLSNNKPNKHQVNTVSWATNFHEILKKSNLFKIHTRSCLDFYEWWFILILWQYFLVVVFSFKFIFLYLNLIAF
jgi:hypothetical protein